MNKNKSIDRQTIHIFWDICLQHRRLLLISIMFPVGAVLLNVIAPLFASKTLGALAMPSGDPNGYLIFFSIAAAAGLVANRIGHPAMVKHQAHVMHDVQAMALRILLKRSVGFHNNNVSGKLVSDAIDYPNAVSMLISTILTNLVPFGLTLIVGAVVIFIASWPLGIFIVVMTATIMGLGIRDSRRMIPLRYVRLEAGKNVTAHLSDSITNIQNIKIFGQEAKELDRHNQLGEKFKNIRIEHWHLMSTRGNKRMLAVVIFQLMFMLVAVFLVRRDPTLLGVGIYAFTFTMMLSGRLFEVNLLLRQLDDALLQAAPMTKIIMETPEIQDTRNATALKVGGGAIAFNDVTFYYKDSSQKDAVFTDLNLNIKNGEKVGLVGPSGGGKSTLTRLLLRFDDINNGQITIDKQNIATVTQKSLRQTISYVPQEPLLFHRTIGENIAYGKPEANLKNIKKAAELAHASDFIDKLPNGYGTIVGERGVKLSGGQRQRIAIARAILKDAPILILDEATSALDSESEVLIQDALWKLMQKRTALVIAHRLSTIQKMDRIIVLDDGKIVEEGNHKQLLKSKGLYAKLWAHQSGGFIEE